MTGNAVKPTLWLIAGANGVGKTSYARLPLVQRSAPNSGLSSAISSAGP
jgi:predicted ATPase